MNEIIYESIIVSLREELQSWTTDNYPIKQIVRVALFSASERMAEEFKKINPEFDRDKFLEVFTR